MRSKFLRARRRQGTYRPAAEILEERALMAADMVLQWNDIILQAIRTDKTAPPIAARDLAIMHLAIYDAVNSIDRTHAAYHISMAANPLVSLDAAVAAAAHRALVNLFPAQAATFDANFTTALDEVEDGVPEDSGVALGEAIADAILELRQDDGATNTVTYTPGTEPGQWRPTPRPNPSVPGTELAGLPALLPQWPDLTPFAMTSGSQFRPHGIPALTSSQYAAALNEVKELGAKNSETRTDDQTNIALFWANGSGTATPPGHLNLLAQEVSELKGTNLVDNARLFALLNVALADAAIVSWDAKYATNFWRPITAIREADTDGNPATEADPTWTPLIVTPPFPTYTSGHSTFSGAATAVLADFYGSNQMTFTLPSENLAVPDRSFTSLSQAAQESAVSRMYGGIHFNFDNNDGLITGRALGHYVSDLLFPKKALPAQVQVENGTLTIVGTAKADRIHVSLERNQYVVRQNGRVLEQVPFDSVQAIAIQAGSGNDRIQVDSRIRISATIYCGSGNDTAYGGGGDDLLLGEDGSDWLFGRNGNDELNGGRGRDRLSGNAGDDILSGDDGDDTLFGDSGNDSLDGGLGKNRLSQ